MADIFISYKRGEENVALAALHCLESAGYSVWCDRLIPAGAPWEATIERELEASRAVIVVWSRGAVISENVKAEARKARDHKKLVQVFAEPCEPPLFFGERQGIDLSGWFGDSNDDRFKCLVSELGIVLGQEVAGRMAEHSIASDVSRIWQRLRQSDDVEELERFVATFDRTKEAFEARHRIDRLRFVLPIREFVEWLEYNDLEADEAIAHVFSQLESIDAFLDRHSETEWTTELLAARAKVRDAAISVSSLDANSDGYIYEYDLYQYEREVGRKPTRP